ncbi:DUF29 domain-containing protein [Endozoicomonas acroporae]|uniref:DUF29 domain-containing protein n=1 Tax=Endozoicomonas acroporae TaxID=1701104 RepID=UPI003D79EE4E
MQNSKNNLYDTDYHQWAEQQKELLRTGQFERLDIDNLLEELGEVMANNRHAMLSQVLRLLTHLLKHHYQMTVLNPQRHEPHQFRSWTDSISDARDQMNLLLQLSPSLKREIPNMVGTVYPAAKNSAIRQMNKYLPKAQWLTEASFPDTCPWLQEQLLDEDWLP